jgi:hypothetical protein
MDWRWMARTVLARWEVAKRTGRWASMRVMGLQMMQTEGAARRQKAKAVAMVVVMAMALTKAMAMLVVGKLGLVELTLEGPPAAAWHDKSHTPAQGLGIDNAI